MKINLLHNKIVAETISVGFERSFMEGLVPLLSDKFGDIIEIQMYEDYLADGFSKGGYWYYPLTVVTESGIHTQWVRWSMLRGDFEGGNPYSFVGDGSVRFSLVDEAPDGFEKKLEGRARYCEEGLIKVSVETADRDATFLSGKYSQTFIDEMSRQLTKAIESATSVEGLAASSLELVLCFAFGTYMEHTSENVTYRRLMLIDKASAPRDFWIKWTRLDSAVGCSVSANVSSDTILFELGEDVDQKIREKEYRYLLVSGKDRYHNAMGRKNVTEWREIIKRAIRRGELTKVECDVELSPEIHELEAKLATLLGRTPEQRRELNVAEPVLATATSSDFDKAMEKARLVVEGAVDESEVFVPAIEQTPVEEIEEDEPEIEVEIVEEPVEEAIEEPMEAVEEIIEEIEEVEEIEGLYDDEDDGELDEITRLALEALASAKDNSDEDTSAEENASSDSYTENLFDIPMLEQAEEEEELVFEEIPEEEPTFEGEDEQTLAELRALEPDEIDEPEAEEYAVEEETIEEPIVEVVEEPALESVEEAIEEPAVDEPVYEDESVEEPVYEDESVEEPVYEDESVEESVEAEEIEEIELPEEERQVVTEEFVRDIAERAEDIRAELEAKIRLEYENRARIKAEQELAEQRRENERIRMESEAIAAEAKAEAERIRLEYERLREQTKRAEAVREAREAVRRAEEEKLRAQIELHLRQEARERERLAEAARLAIEEQHRLEAENARIARQREEETRIAEEARRREEEDKRLEELRRTEVERIRREAEEEAEKRAKSAMPDMGDGKYSYTSKSVKLIFRRSVDPNITSRIYEIIKATVEYYGKDRITLRIKASVPDSQTVILDFLQIPMEEMTLLGNIIKILGNSGLGIAKAIIE